MKILKSLHAINILLVCSRRRLNNLYCLHNDRNLKAIAFPNRTVCALHSRCHYRMATFLLYIYQTPDVVIFHRRCPSASVLNNFNLNLHQDSRELESNNPRSRRSSILIVFYSIALRYRWVFWILNPWSSHRVAKRQSRKCLKVRWSRLPVDWSLWFARKGISGSPTVRESIVKQRIVDEVTV